jgi:hypothetical protein
MSGAPVIVYAFDPVAELRDAMGLLVLSAELAGRLVAEHRVEVVGDHINAPLRFVAGSAANVAARDALRAARAGPGTRARKVARLEQ